MLARMVLSDPRSLKNLGEPIAYLLQGKGRVMPLYRADVAEVLTRKKDEEDANE